MGGPNGRCPPATRPCSKRRWTRQPLATRDVDYRPVLIDAAYAGLLTESGREPLVVPALNRDGDCLSDLVLALFGSIAGAESVLMAFDDELRTVVAMAEAPHGTAPSLEGKDVANPMAMLLACAAVLEHAAGIGYGEAGPAAVRLRDATLGAAADGVRTFDLGGHATTSGVVDEVIRRVRHAPATPSGWP